MPRRAAAKRQRAMTVAWRARILTALRRTAVTDGVGRDAQADEGADGRRVDGAPGAEEDDGERAEGGGGEARNGVGEDSGVLGVFGGEDRGEARVVRA